MKFTIDRQKWLRGEGGMYSYLLRPSDGKQCCVGMYLEHCGVTTSELKGKAVISELCATITPSAGWLMNQSPRNELYSTNDDRELSDAERERDIAKYFATVGVEVEFIN